MKEDYVNSVVLNVVPQVECHLVEFWMKWQRLVIGADFSGYIGKWNRGDKEMMGGYDVKERNAKRETGKE